MLVCKDVFMKAYILFLIFIMLCSGCIISPKNDGDAGSYTVSVREDTIYSFQGGGGIFVLHLEPESDFEGDVGVSVYANNKFNSTIYNTNLTREKPTCEIVVKPVNNMKTGEYPVSVICRHADKSKTVFLNVVVQTHRAPVTTPPELPSTFIEWLGINCPELNIDENQSWFGFYATNSIPGAPAKKIFLCPEWEIYLKTISYPPFTIAYSLRKRYEYRIEKIIEEKNGSFQIVNNGN